MIGPERWRQIDELLLATLEREPTERPAFLREACADDESLRLEVESLLASGEQAVGIIDRPAFDVAADLLATHIPELTEGEQLGHYRILTFLGAGGMGEVYLAEDLQLDRRVAIKLLQGHSTIDRKQLQRFDREARTASALNHPNILTIHELGELNGRQFIATEFVEGETLRQRLRRGRLDVFDAFDIAIQTAGALAAAHNAGIVHRDVKPENIMLRPDGYVKVLDFGLAKLNNYYERQTDTRILAHADVSSGLVMGTVKYMSPEQARGAPVDFRSDVFSLGVVLYEMLTGHTPFKGDAVADLIKSTATQEPDALLESVPDLPAKLEQIVIKALAKDRTKRHQSMNDLSTALTELRHELEVDLTLKGLPRPSINRSPRSDVTAANTNSTITQQVVTLVMQHKMEAGVTLFAVLLTFGGIFYSSMKRAQKIGPFQEVQMSPLVETDRSQFVAISRDGNYLAHTVVDEKGQSVWLRNLVTNSNLLLVPSSGAWFSGLTFSPDGGSVYFVQQPEDDKTSALYQVPVTGGESRKVLSDAASPITFSPDGSRFAFVRNVSSEETGLFVSNLDGSGEKSLGQRRRPGFFSPVGPSWSADGKIIACAVFGERGDEHPSYMNVVGVNVDDGSEKRLTNGKWFKVLQVAWLSDNSGFIMAATQKGEGALLWYVSYPEGKLRKITNDPSNYPSDYNSISVSADSSKLVASRFEQRTNLWSALSGDPNQIKQITFGGNHRFQRLAWTPDGKVVFPSDASGDRELWLMEGNGGNLKQLTADGHFNQLPTVSPDGRYVVYVSGSESRHIWRMNIDGTEAVQLTHGGDQYGPQVSPDSRWVLYVSIISGKATIWKIPIDGGEPQQLTNDISTWPVVSPDGTQIACWWWATPKSPPKIAIIPFGGGPPIKFLEPLPEATRELPIRWTSNGASIIYCVTREGVSNVWRQSLDGSAPNQLTDFKSETIRGFDWSRDDRLLLSRGFTAREIILIRNVNP